MAPSILIDLCRGYNIKHHDSNYGKDKDVAHLQPFPIPHLNSNFQPVKSKRNYVIFFAFSIYMCKVFSAGVKTYHVVKTFYSFVKGPCSFSQTPFPKMIRLSPIIADMNLK